MYILYLDESGTHEASYFVLAGLAVFEREIHWFSQDLDRLQQKHFPKYDKSVFFHARDFHGSSHIKLKAPLDECNNAQLREIKGEVYQILYSRKAILFGCAIEK